MTRSDLVRKYMQSRNDLARIRALVDAAALFDEVLSDLETLWAAEEQAELSLASASIHCGYSEDHLRRLAREGKLAHTRKGRRLYFRAGDLPLKPGRVDTGEAAEYDPAADARQVAAQRNRGAYPWHARSGLM